MMISRFLTPVMGITLLFLAPLNTALASSKLAHYHPKPGVSGRLSSVGSDTVGNLMASWTSAFNRYYPGVRVESQAQGSSTAPPALISGASNLGPMSRMMKDEEIRAFKGRFGYAPTAIPIALDGVAVSVNRANPVRRLSVAQIDAIFSSTRRCGAPKALQSWGDVGAKGAWASRAITRYGRNSVSGTYAFFKHQALCKGDYLNTVNEQPGSSSVVQSVGGSLGGIGYSGVGYVSSRAHFVAVSKKKGSKAYRPTPSNIASGRYPLSRYIYLYVNKAPNKPLAPLTREFITFILSREGQKIVVKNGFVAVPVGKAKKVLRHLSR